MNMMRYAIVKNGDSRSFPLNDAFLSSGSDLLKADVVIHLGKIGAPTFDASKAAILIELGSECLGTYTGESLGEEGSNVLGFARYTNGADAPSSLVEIVRQPRTLDSAITAARAVFENAGLKVSLCTDQVGRIIDRLVRPKYNAALTFLDEGLATAKDMDLACRLGLGYPDGLIERVERGGLAHHYHVTKNLFEIYGTPAYAPARRAVVAALREKLKDTSKDKN
jgi:3-hydroxybutyryl-CoA dehydrogenase